MCPSNMAGRCAVFALFLSIYIPLKILMRFYSKGQAVVSLNRATNIEHVLLVSLTVLPTLMPVLPIHSLPIFSFFGAAAWVLLLRNNAERAAWWITVSIAIPLVFLIASIRPTSVGSGIRLHLPSVAYIAAIVPGFGVGVLVRFVYTYRVGGLCISTRWLRSWRPIAAVQEELDNFDLIFEGDYAANSSRFTQFFGRSSWTHVGIIVRRPPSALLSRLKHRLQSPSNCWVFESVRPAVRLIPIEHFIAQHDQPHKVLAVQRLDFHRSELSLSSLHQSIHDWLGKSFKMQPKEMVMAPYRMNASNPDTDSIFCSELVIHTFRACGLMRRDTKLLPNNYMPNDFVFEKDGGGANLLRFSDHFCEDVKPIECVRVVGPKLQATFRPAGRQSTTTVQEWTI